jgi:hypothetical protein
VQVSGEDAFVKLCLAIPKAYRATFSLGKNRNDLPVEQRTYRVKQGENRDFATWMRKGDQIGPHVRHANSASSGYPISTAYRKGPQHNWIFVASADAATLAKLVADSNALSSARNAGVVTPLFAPLAKAVSLAPADQVPVDLHAGGPAAKIVGQEGPASFRLALWMTEQIVGKAPKSEIAGVRKTIVELLAASDLFDELLPKLMQIGGRMGASVDKLSRAGNKIKNPKGTSAPVLAAIEAIRAFSSIPGGYNNDAVRAATVAAQQAMRVVAKPRTFLSELDDRILAEELRAVMLAKGDGVKRFTRVLWRGVDAKGFTALWIAKIAKREYGLFWKLGKRWTWTTADRDNTLANVPDAQFEAAVAMTTKRDK